MKVTVLVRQQNRFIALMENFGRVQEINNELVQAGGTLNQSYATYLDSVEASANRARASFETMWINALNSDAIKYFYDMVTAINQTIDRFGVLKVAMTGLITIMLLGTKTTRDFTNALAFNAVAKGTMQISNFTKGLVGLNAQTKNNTLSLKKLGAMFSKMSFKKIGMEVKTLTMAFKQQWMALINKKTAVKGATVSQTMFTSALIGTKMATIALKVAVVALQVALSLGLSAVLTVLLSKITQWIGSSQEARMEQERLIETTNRQIESHTRNIRTLSELSDEFDKLTSKMGENRDETRLSSEELTRYNEILEQIKEIAPELIAGYDSQGEAILDTSFKVDDLIEKEKELLAIQRERLKLHGREDYDESSERNEEIRDDIRKIDEFFDWQERGAPSDERIHLFDEDGDTFSTKMREGADLRAISQEMDARRNVLMAELNENQQAQREILQAFTTSIYDIEGVSDELKNRALEPVENIFLGDMDSEGDYTKGIINVELLENAIHDAVETLEGMDSVATKLNSGSLDHLVSNFEEIGMSADEARDYVFDLHQSLNFGEATLGAIDFEQSDFEDLISEIRRVDSAYDSLSVGDRLDTDEMLELIAMHEELAEYIAETGDLTLDQGEALVELKERELNTMREEIRTRQEQYQVTMRNARETLRAEEEKLRAIEEYYGYDSEQAEQQRSNVQSYRTEVQGLEDDLSRATNELKAFERIQQDAFDTTQVEEWKNAFSDASGDIDSYEQIIEEIQEYGRISGQTKRDIVMNHPELIHLLGQEGDMRVYLNELIHKQVEVQQESYRNMMLSSEAFSRNMYDNNKDLFDHIFDLYDLDLKNFRTVQQLKSEMALQSARNMAQIFQNMILPSGGSELETLQAELSRIQGYFNQPEQSRRWQGSVLSSAEEAELKRRKEQVKAEIALLESIDTAIPDVDFNIELPELDQGSMAQSFTDLDEIEVAIDRYLKFTKALEENQTAIDRNAQVLENATGADRINLLSKEIGLLSQRKDLMRLNIREHERERNELRRSVRRHVDLDDGTMGIDSFNAELQAREDAINSLIRQINASSSQSARDSMTEQKDAMEEALNEFKEDFERYIDLEMTIIPELETDRWQLELEKFNLTLEAINANMEKYSKQIDHINDKISVMAYAREQNLDLLSEEYDYLSDISVLYQDSLLDVERQLEDNQRDIDRYERNLRRLGDTRNEEYQRIARSLSLARAKQDELYEAQRQAVVALSQAQQNIIENYMSQLELAKQKTIETLSEMRAEADRFDLHAMKHSLEEITYELDKIDKMFMEGAEPVLSTTQARKDLRGLRDDLSDMVNRTERMQSRMQDIVNREVKTEEQRNQQREDLVSLIEDQIGYEEELLALQESLTEEIAETELEHQKIEDSLQNQIDLKEEELRQLEEQFQKEDDIRSALQKQLELMRAMDDRRHSYITGMGEEIFTYDRSQVRGLEREVADLKRDEERQDKLDALRDEIERMQEELATTQEIHRQQLAILQTQLGHLDDILGVLSSDISDGLGEEGLGAVYEQMGDAFVEKVNEAMEPFVDSFEEIWKAIMDRMPIEGYETDKDLELGTSPSDPNLGAESSPSGWQEYVVRSGDTLSQIARRFNTTVDELLNANPDITDPNKISSGMPIQVPESFDTGGYTGDFKGGKKAILHEKELVLNKKDTENVLASVDIARAIASKLGDISNKASTENIDNSRNTDVTISKIELPNVKDGKSFVNEMYDMFRDGMPSMG